MLDIKFLRENPDIVKQNIKNKFQDRKLPLVDEVIELDLENRKIKQEVEALRADRNKLSKQIGGLMAKGEKEEAERVKAEVAKNSSRVDELTEKEKEVEEKIKKIMMTIPNIIDPSVPIGKDDSENVEVQKYGEPVVPDFEVPYHTDIMESFNGIDLDSARKVAGNGFYYLMGDIARLHSAVISYARDFMIDRGFTYCVPPFMIRSDVVTGVMSFDEMDAMMYKIEGEDLYLIGTSEHSMIGKFIDTVNKEADLPYTLTSYSPCFRKEKGAHGIEERGVYRIHQFEKQEMIVVCKPEESKMWFDKLWQNTVDLFRSMDIPVRTLECCSGDLADLKVKSIDVEAWSPRQKKYFEVGSCSNLGDAQARRLRIRVVGENGERYFAHTLNNTVVAQMCIRDRVYVGRPDVKGREAILRVHAAGKPFADDVDFSVVAKTTSGFTGADLENLLNEAALLTARAGKKKIDMEELQRAFVKVGIGTEKKSRIISEKEKLITAYHESGHAILFEVLEKCDPVHSVSIIPTGMAGGYTMPLPGEDKMYMTKGEMEDEIISFLGGRAAEEIVLKDITTGASNDIERATAMARNMVMKYGMSSKFGPVQYGDESDEVFIGRDIGHSRNYSENTADAIDAEVKELINFSYNEAKRLLNENIDVLHASAKLLMEKEKITGDEFRALFKKDSENISETDDTAAVTDTTDEI